MENGVFNRIMPPLVIISLGALGIGVLFQIQHWPNGKIIASLGLISYLVISQIEIKRLRKIIANSSKEDVEV